MRHALEAGGRIQLLRRGLVLQLLAADPPVPPAGSGIVYLFDMAGTIQLRVMLPDGQAQVLAQTP